jgi:hypothetical protein
VVRGEPIADIVAENGGRGWDSGIVRSAGGERVLSLKCRSSQENKEGNREEGKREE